MRGSSSIFNGCALVGDLRDGYNHIYVDKNNMCSLILKLGHNIMGGDTLYYSGQNPQKTGEIVHSEAFHHDKFLVEPFQKDIHAGSHWKGSKGLISFYVNK